MRVEFNILKFKKSMLNGNHIIWTTKLGRRFFVTSSISIPIHQVENIGYFSGNNNGGNAALNFYFNGPF